MNRLEILSVAVALGVGSVVGFVGARWGRTDSAGKGGQELRSKSPATAGAEAATPVTATDPLEAIMADGLQSRRLVALDRYCEGLDAEAVRRAVQSMPSDYAPKNVELRRRLLSRWAEINPAAAATFALKRGGLLDVLTVWVSQDPEAAKQFVASMKDKLFLEPNLYSFTLTLIERDSEEALKFADLVPETSRHHVVWAFFRAAGYKDPSAAVARAMTLPAGKMRESAVESATAVWLQTDPQAAMAWVMQRPDTTVTYGGTLLNDALQRWAGSDPAAATRYVQSLPPGGQRDGTMSTVVWQWSYRDPEQALQWVQGLPEDGAKAQVLGSVLSAWCLKDPQAAVEFVARQPPGIIPSDTMGNIGNRWAQLDPEGALSWAAAQPNDFYTKQIVPQALGTLAADDPSRAVEGLAGLHNPEIRAAAITAIARLFVN